MREPSGIRLDGELDLSSLPSLELAMEMLLDQPGDIVVDTRGLTFIDVSGARVLARSAIHLREAGRKLRLLAVSPFVKRVLIVLGWAPLFEFDPAIPPCGWEE